MTTACIIESPVIAQLIIAVAAAARAQLLVQHDDQSRLSLTA
jgi:hypothetical protein